MSAVSMPWLRQLPRWWAIALGLSVALNAFLIGAIATDLIEGRDSGRPGNYELRWLEGRIPADGLAKVDAALDAVRPNAQAHFQRLRELRQSLAELAALPEPDRAAIDARLADIRNELDQVTSEMRRTSIDALLALPPEMRAGLAKNPD